MVKPPFTICMYVSNAHHVKKKGKIPMIPYGDYANHKGWEESSNLVKKIASIAPTFLFWTSQHNKLTSKEKKNKTKNPC